MRTVEQIYRYERPSDAASRGGQFDLRLSTAGGSSLLGSAENPSYFAGYLTHPEVAASALAACAVVARNRYYVPPNLVAAKIKAADPVVTSNGDRLRFESFSVCWGAYLRFDVQPEGLDSPPTMSGTTNVDFNIQTQQSLAAWPSPRAG